MSKFDMAMRTLTYTEEIGQDDLSLCADLSKLVFIANSIVREYGDMIVGIYVSPANIIQTALEKLGKIEILIHVNYSVDAEPKEFNIKDFCEYYLKEEYPELTVSRVSVTDTPPRIGSYLCLYTNSELAYPSEADFTDEELVMLSKILKETRFMIEISKDWNNVKHHVFLIHVQKTEEYMMLVSCIPKFKSWYGVHFTEPNDFILVPATGFNKLPYELPYDYIYAEDLDLQRLEEILKNPEE